ncbi:MAG: hypothetical protein K9W42_07180 [Candidatus Heimdallarchaeota archaeon]|nr:hypothetical protein [Candidatus Heimdallarchaeota archaeon]
MSNENEKNEEVEQTNSEENLTEEDEEPIETKEAEEPIETKEAEEPIETKEAEEPIETKEAEEPIETKEAEEPKEEEIETEEAKEELEIPEIPLEESSEEEIIEAATPTEEPEVEELPEEEYSFEAKKAKPVKKKKKKGLPFLLSTLIGLGVALLIEVLFSIPLWVGGVGRPDLFYIELVLVLIAMSIPGLFTRSLQKGILGAFMIFIVAFAVPLLLTVLGLKAILSPLTPLFASTDFSLDAFQIFKSLFPALENLPIAQIQKWIWIVDLVLMFILTIFVVVIITALIKSITKKKKKVGTWIAIPLLSIGLIIFAVFTPIIFSSTYGIIQASTSFLAGATKMQEAYGLFEGTGSTPSTQAMEWMQNNLSEANYWLNISQANYEGLQNIGLIRIAVLVSGQYGPLIEAGDQLALATMAMTGILLPLFTGIYDLTQSLENATNDMANFGSSSSATTKNVLTQVSTKSLENIDQLKEDIIRAIEGLDKAENALNIIQQRIAQQDIQGSFDEIKAKLESINIAELPAKVGDIINEIRVRLDQFDGQLEGFVNFISYTADNLEPTKKILWASYNTIIGNEYLKLRRFKNATDAFIYAYQNISAITGIATYTTTGNLTGIFAADITEDFTFLLNDLIEIMSPLLQEEIAFAQTYDAITKIMRTFAAEGDISQVDYSSLSAPLTTANNTDIYGVMAQSALGAFRTKLQNTTFGSMFNDIGTRFDKILTDDFRPLEFGIMTKFMGTIVAYYLTSCESYANQYFTEAINNITIADNIMTNDLLPILDVNDPRYLQDYYNNWSLALGELKTKMETYNTPADYSNGLTAIQNTILALYANVEEK